MKTWGLNKKTSVHTWGLGGFFGPVVQSFINAVRAIVQVTRELRR